MRWLRHKKARNDRDAGLAFAWRVSSNRVGSTLVGALAVGTTAAVFATLVNVRVLSPPARSGHRGTLVLAADDKTTEWLDGRGAELTPFPAPLAVHGLEETERALAAHPAMVSSAAKRYVPALREWAGEPAPAMGSVAEAGRTELPPLPALASLPAVGDDDHPPAGGGRQVLVLMPDEPELAARVPVPLPAFDAGAALQTPEGGLRFLIHIDAAGRVLTAVPLGGDAGSSAGAVPVERWLRGVRFEAVEDGAGWFALAVGAVVSGND